MSPASGCDRAVLNPDPFGFENLHMFLASTPVPMGRSFRLSPLPRETQVSHHSSVYFTAYPCQWLVAVVGVDNRPELSVCLLRVSVPAFHHGNECIRSPRPGLCWRSIRTATGLLIAVETSAHDYGREVLIRPVHIHAAIDAGNGAIGAVLPDSAGAFIAAGIGPLGAPVAVTFADSIRHDRPSERCRSIKSGKVSGSLQPVAEGLDQSGAEISPAFNLLFSSMSRKTG